MVLKPDMGAYAVPVQDPCWPDAMPALSMTYSPWQQWGPGYEAEVALSRGTIFPGLDKPFLEGACPCV